MEEDRQTVVTVSRRDFWRAAIFLGFCLIGSLALMAFTVSLWI